MNLSFFSHYYHVQKRKKIKNTKKYVKINLMKIFVKITSLMMTSLLNFQNLEFFVFLVLYD